MKARRTLFTALLTLPAVFASSTAMADADTDKEALRTMTHTMVQSALTETNNDINQKVINDVLTASYRVTPENEAVTYVAKVDVKQLKDEG